MSRRFSIVMAWSCVVAPVVRAQGFDDARWLNRCHDDWGDWRARHCEVRVSTIAAGGLISINPGENGGVAIVGWDGATIEIHAHIQTSAASDSDAAELARGIRVVTAGTTIHVDAPDMAGRHSWGVSLAVYVPRHSDLKLDTYNGPISVREVTGGITVAAHNGPVSLDAVGGDVHARTTNGPLDINLAGAHWEGTGLDAETTNGPVALTIPEKYSARLEFGTVNGPMTVGFPLTVTVQGRLTQRIVTTLGSGGPLIRAVTTNGPFEIRRE